MKVCNLFITDIEIDKELDSCLLFGKYSDLPCNNILETAVTLLINTKECFQALKKQEQTNKFGYQTDIILSCLEQNLNEIIPQYNKLFEKQGIIPELANEIIILTQNKTEAINETCTKFKFEVSDLLSYKIICNTIEENYGRKLDLYYHDMNEKLKYKLKDEDDFKEVLNKLMQNITTNSLVMKFLVEDVKSGVIYVIQCNSCGKNIQLDKNEYESIKDKNSDLCDTCKKNILKAVSSLFNSGTLPRLNKPSDTKSS